MAIKIVTDSTSYISDEYIKKYDIKLVSLNVIINGVSSREIDIENEVFYEEIKNSKEIPKSSQPIPEEMLNTFREIVEDGDSIVGIFLSSKMSGTYSNANMIKDMILEDYPDAEIHILDSKTNCMQMGFAVIEAARTASEGKSINEVINAANHVINNSRFLFTPETLEYLKKGGRISSTKAAVGSILNIKPILEVKDGLVSQVGQVRGKKNVVNKMMEYIKDRLGDDIDNSQIYIGYSDDEKEKEKITEVAKEMFNPEKIEYFLIGTCVGAHSGPGVSGILCFKK